MSLNDTDQTLTSSVSQDSSTTLMRGQAEAMVRPSALADEQTEGTARNEDNLYDGIAGLFVNDSFAEEVAAFVQEARQRERDECARETAS